MPKTWIIIGAVFGFLSVSLGAFGAHSLREILDTYGKEIYEKAVFYQVFHALAIVAIGVLQKQFPQASFDISGWSFVAGILLFSGSLYFLAITGVKWLGAVTPFGGLAFLLGWGWLVYVMLKFSELR